MNRNEYMAALRRALAGLPEEERASALRYYEEYFDDAGPENERKAIDGLGAPEQVAAQILADYRELTAVPLQGRDAGSAAAKPRRRWRGISPWLLIVLVLLAIPVGVPLLLGAAATVLGLLVAAAAVVFAFAIVVPFALLLAGAMLCGFSFALWGAPASAVATLGCGLALLALGVLVSLLIIKLCMLFVPPVCRGLVALIRWPFDRLHRRKNGGEPQ